MHRNIIKEKYSEKNITLERPANGISANKFFKIIGKKQSKISKKMKRLFYEL